MFIYHGVGGGVILLAVVRGHIRTPSFGGATKEIAETCEIRTGDLA